ncbi:MAG: YjbQ family protein [Candidatus Latescibacterota bacterium]|nr:MAG: YjbQ family protein [Candidatus Latescibacterota bacterium]
MQTRRKRIELQGSAEMDVFDVTADVDQFIQESGVEEGLLLVFTPGSTAGVTTIEFESGAVSDLKRTMEKLAPRDAEYQHNLRWGDGNGYSHVRSALLGPSLAVPVEAGKPVVGTWQQIVVCDFDNRPRRRKVLLQLLA